MARPLVDRRRDARVALPEIGGTHAILRPGYLVSVIDLSAGGALIQGPRPLRPGARVQLQLVTATCRLALSGEILRCSVAALDAREGVRYRGAVQFDHRAESLWEAGTLDGYHVPAGSGTTTMTDGHGLPDGLPASDDESDRRQQ